MRVCQAYSPPGRGWVVDCMESWRHKFGDEGEEVHGAAVHPGGHLDGAGEDVARICATLPSPSPVK